MGAVGRCIYGVCVVLVLFGVNAHADTVVERMEKRCRQYATSVYEMSTDPILLPGAKPKRRDTCRISSSTTIVGGQKAIPQEFPHMALIGYGDEPTKWRCGGSLISEQWVLSAAHCAATTDTHLLALYARLGDLDLLSTKDDAKPKTYRIVKRVKHKNYTRSQAYNDIALFKLEEPVKFDRYIRPICLHGLLSQTNNTVIASGWGATLWNYTSSSHLLKVGLDVVGNDQCNKEWEDNVVGDDATIFHRLLMRGITDSTQVCAWAPGKDSCQGDSGGPIQQLLLDPYCMYTIIGITSVGHKCGGRIPGVYTRVSHYLPWIESIVWPQE